MNPRENYRQKIAADMEQAQNKLAEFKAQPRSLTAEDRVKHIRHIEELEQRVVNARGKWQKVGDSDDAWGRMQGDAESLWKALQDEIHETITDVQS